MTRAEYDRSTNAQWIGRKLRTLTKLRSGHVEIPPGMILTVTKKFDGFTVVGPRCDCCNVAVIMSKVHYSDVETVHPQAGDKPVRK